ncbi:MAG: YceI family protein [bacterium]|nr:YceI family protein [bacterium]
MKKASVFFLAATALFVASCSSEETTDENGTEEKVEAVTYTLDPAATTLKWHGEMSPEYGHDGTVQVTEGSITMMGDALESGSFKIDMNSIKVTDEGMDDEKKGYLAAHLKGTAPDEDHPQNMFWNTPDFPMAMVTLNSYDNGQLSMTLNVIGKDVETTVPATIKQDGDKVMIMGDFPISFADMGIPGFMVPESGDGINPSVEFSLNAVLTK